MTYDVVKLKFIFSIGEGKEYIALGHDYLLVNKNGRFRILGKTLDEVIKNLKRIGREDIIKQCSGCE